MKSFKFIFLFIALCSNYALSNFNPDETAASWQTIYSGQVTVKEIDYAASLQSKETWVKLGGWQTLLPQAPVRVLHYQLILVDLKDPSHIVEFPLSRVPFGHKGEFSFENTLSDSPIQIHIQNANHGTMEADLVQLDSAPAATVKFDLNPAAILMDL